MNTEEKALINTLLEYEIFSSWWGWIMPSITANYFAWKVVRKYNKMISIKNLREKK